MRAKMCNRHLVSSRLAHISKHPRERYSSASGSASELLIALNALVSEEQRRAKTWPNAAHVLSGRVKRAATFLRRAGIDIDQGHRSKSARQITITRLDETVTPTVANPSGCPDKMSDPAGSDADHVLFASPRTRGDKRHLASPASPIYQRGDARDDTPFTPTAASVTSSPLKSLDDDAGDAGDAVCAPLSGADGARDASISEAF